MAYNTRKKSISSAKPLPSTYSESDDYSDSGSEYKGSDSSDTKDDDSTEHDSNSDSQLDSSDSVSKTLSKSLRLLDIRKSGTSSKQDKIYVIKSDDYFSHSSQTKSAISKNTLDKLETPQLQPNELQKLLSKRELMIKHRKELSTLEKSNRNEFSRWLYLMHEGFNILLFGLGSKMEILQDFQSKFLNDLPVVVVNGFFPSLVVKTVVEGILADILELTESPTNIYEACDLIAETLSSVPGMHLYVIVHNIEGDMLKNGKAQNVLSRLASTRNIHLIASIDHVSAPLIWDNSKLSRFNFVWCDATSFLPYISETSFESSMTAQRSKTLALSALNNVFLSLTSNAKGIYLKIVKYQLENGNSQQYQGYLFKDLYWACREAFLVSSDLALRSQLTEFLDHKMLKNKRAADGSEYVIIPTATNILQQFYDEQSK